MKILNKEDIFACEDLQKEKLYIPEWKGSVYISELSADVRDEFEQYMVHEQEKIQSSKTKYLHIRTALAAFSVVDENGNLLFSIKDLVELGKKSGRALDRIFTAANKLNKIYGAEREEVEKNSEAPQDVSSGGELQ